MNSSIGRLRRRSRFSFWVKSAIRQACIFIVLMAVLWFVLSEVMGWQILSYQALGYQGWCTFR